MARISLLLLSIIFLLGSCGQENKSKNDDSSNQNIKPTDLFADLDRKIADDPQNAEHYNSRAKLHIASRKFQLAENDVLKALSLDSTKSKYFITLSDVQFGMNKAYKAKASLDMALNIDPDNTEALLKMAEIHLIVKKHPESLDFLNRVLKSDPYNAKAYFMKGMNFKEVGDTAKAISSFLTCIEQDEAYYDAFMQLGILMEAKQDPLALEYFNAAIALKPESQEALYGKALYNQRIEDFDQAIITYTRILEINPCHLDAHFNLGYIHYVFLKVHRQAIKHYDDAIACNNSFLKAYYNRGLAFEALGDIGNARDSYAKALEIDPNYVHAQQGIMRVNK